MSEKGVCFICKHDATNDVGGLAVEWKCDRCGRFLASVALTPEAIKKEFAYKVSAFTRSQPNRLLTPPLVEELQFSADKSIEEKSHLLLENLEKSMGYFGDKIKLHVSNDYPLAEAKNPDEFDALLKLQQELGYMMIENRNSAGTTVSLTARGINELKESRRSSVNSEKVFVAMSFDPALTAKYTDHIAPGITDAGYRPVRIDLEEHNDDIIARVLTAIRESRFVVSDFTGHRNGVYFEAGFAKGLGLEVVWLCHDEHMERAHFDTNHFNHLTWKDGDDLRTKLSTRILATIGPGPLKKPT